MSGQEKSEKQIGLVVGNATFGVALKETINGMKPGEVKLVKTWRKLILVRYGKNGEITVINLMDGSEVYRG